MAGLESVTVRLAGGTGAVTEASAAGLFAARGLELVTAAPW